MNVRTPQYVFSGEVKIAVEASGPFSGPRVVLLHGGGQTRHSWRKVRDRLTAAGYRVLLFDARGHGESGWSPTGDYGFDALADDLLTVVAREAAPVALVGASLGGLTAMNAISRHPSIPCWALALVDVVPQVNSAGRNRILDFMSAYPDGFDSIEAAVEATAAFAPYRRTKANFGLGLARNLRERDGRFFWHWDPAFLASRVAEAGAFPAVEPELRAASFPIMLIRGERSDVVTEADAANFTAAVPNCSVMMVPRAAHMVTGDHNDIFGGAIAAFLDRSSARQGLRAAHRVGAGTIQAGPIQ